VFFDSEENYYGHGPDINVVVPDLRTRDPSNPLYMLEYGFEFDEKKILMDPGKSGGSSPSGGPSGSEPSQHGSSSTSEDDGGLLPRRSPAPYASGSPSALAFPPRFNDNGIIDDIRCWAKCRFRKKDDSMAECDVLFDTGCPKTVLRREFWRSLRNYDNESHHLDSGSSTVDMILHHALQMTVVQVIDREGFQDLYDKLDANRSVGLFGLNTIRRFVVIFNGLCSLTFIDK